jgi:hypothetical protein
MGSWPAEKLRVAEVGGSVTSGLPSGVPTTEADFWVSRRHRIGRRRRRFLRAEATMERIATEVAAIPAQSVILNGEAVYRTSPAVSHHAHRAIPKSLRFFVLSTL